ncbi:AEC family transporter [bacterium]|nr:AEC family transporter [bacterium]
MEFDSLNILLPLFLLILGGFAISRLFSIPEGAIVRIVTDFFMPLLVLHSFCTTKIPLDHIYRLFGVVSLLIALIFAIGWLYCRSFKLDIKAVMPPLLFMNSGFLGIPLMKLWGGLTAMNLIIIYDQIQTFYIFTLGIIIVTGSYRLTGIIEMIRSPLIWAIVVGFGINLAQIEVHPTLLNALKIGGEAAPPLAIFTIGMVLNRYKIRIDRHVLLGVTIRIGFGFLFGLALALLFGFSGMAATVVVIASALPSAVFSVVLPIRYGVNGQYAGSVLIVSTVLSLLTLPLLFHLSQNLIP